MQNQNRHNRWVHAARTHFPWDFMSLILLSYIIPALYGLLNRYFIGYMSYDSVIVDQSYEALEVIFEVFLEMFPLAVLALVAKQYHDLVEVKKTVVSSALLQCILTLVFVLITWFTIPWFIDWIHTPAAAQILAVRYFRIKTFSLPLQALATVFLIAIKSLKKGKTALFIACFTLVVNFLLDAIFISNFSWSLHLGLIGSAWNTFASSLFSFLLSGFVLYRILHHVECPSINLWSTARSIFRIGKWTGLESGIRNLGYIMGVVTVVNIIGATDPSAIGGYNTAIWVMWVITLVPVLAWTEATNIAVGHAYGQQDVQGMKDVQVISTVLMGGYMVLWVGIGFLWWDDISMWLNAGIQSEVATYSMRTFTYLIWPYILFTVGSGLKSFFIGTGQPQAVFWTSTIVNGIIYIPVGIYANANPTVITYTAFLWITVGVFCIDFGLTCAFLAKWGYNRLKFDHEVKDA